MSDDWRRLLPPPRRDRNNKSMIIPGILEQTTEEAVKKINLLGNIAPKIQLDIADGMLVTGKTFQDISFLTSLQTSTQVQLHLMVQKPEEFLLLLPPVVKEVCIQVEAFMYKPLCLESFDDVLKSKNIRAGLSFNSTTPFKDFADCIKQCDFVQFMTVDPGAQGRPFLMAMLDKIARFKDAYPDTVLQVDGGIAQDTLPMVIEAGADDLIVGSAIYKSGDPTESYKNFVLQFDHAHRNYLANRQRQRYGGEKTLQD